MTVDGEALLKNKIKKIFMKFFIYLFLIELKSCWSQTTHIVKEYTLVHTHIYNSDTNTTLFTFKDRQTDRYANAHKNV